jgi:hypothetical protein
MVDNDGTVLAIDQKFARMGNNKFNGSLIVLHEIRLATILPEVKLSMLGD